MSLPRSVWGHLLLHSATESRSINVNLVIKYSHFKPFNFVRWNTHSNDRKDTFESVASVLTNNTETLYVSAVRDRKLFCFNNSSSNDSLTKTLYLALHTEHMLASLLVDSSWFEIAGGLHKILFLMEYTKSRFVVSLQKLLSSFHVFPFEHLFQDT